MTEYEFSGKTVEEAVQLGLKTMGLTLEEVNVAVVEEGKKGGLFSKGVPARVKLSKKCTDGERAVAFLDGMFDLLGVTATTELEETEENTRINVITNNNYALIGHRGEVLDALQVLAGAVANIGREEYKRVVVDCENYREKREQTLKRLAEKLAEKAVRLGRKVSLEPMTPYERRIIHATLADNDKVKTVSEGKEPNRFIVVIPNNLKPGAERSERRGGKPCFDRDRKGGFNRDKKDNFERKDRKGGFNRDDKARASGTPRAKRQPYFGTFLGNSNDVKKEDQE